MIQEAIVGLIVVLSVLAVLRRYMPKKLRLFVASTCSSFLNRIGMPGLALRLSRVPSSAARCADGCGSCENRSADGDKSVATEFSMTPDALKKTIRRS